MFSAGDALENWICGCILFHKGVVCSYMGQTVSLMNVNIRNYLSILMKTLYILDWWMGHWRRSVENLSIMRKVFFYLLCMVLILPSVGMTSLRGFFQMFIDEAQSNHTMPTNSTLKWNCIFL